MTFFGLLNLPWWGYIIVTLVLTHITMACVTIYLHRAQAHRALDLHPIPAHFFRFWLWLTTGMKTKEWVAVHRKHHAKCETPEDPHSPQVEGINEILWKGAEYYRASKKNQDMLDKFGKGTPDDWVERRVYSTPFLRGKLGIIIMLLIDLVLLGVPGVIVWGIQMAWTPFFAAGVINGIGHYIGYRNFECNDASTNIVPWGILIGGEELHNNHHTYGTSAKLSAKWWEFDIGWQYIKLLRAFGLAKVKRLPPEIALDPNKPDIDLDTVKALVVNRFQVLTRYSKDVIKPVFNTEREAGQKSALCRRVRKLLCRNETLLTEDEQAQVAKALTEHSRLQKVYQFRDQLQEIWGRTTASHKELIEAVQDWCKRAEQSGIDSLARFAQFVRSYQLHTKK